MAALTWCLVLSSGAGAQIVHGQRPQITQGLDYISWEASGAKEFTISQWYVPITVRAGLRENLELGIYSAAARSESDLSETDNTLTGLIDSKLQLSASFLDDGLLLSTGVSLPTGKTKLDEPESDLVGWLTADFLNFPVKNPGEGLNIFGQLGMAAPLGRWVFGAAGAVYVAGEYSPYDSDLKYTPGSRLVGNVGIERNWENRHRLATDFVVIYSTDDKVAGKPVFRDGVQLDGRVIGQTTMGSLTVDGAFRAIIRGKDYLPDGEGSLVSELNNRNGNDLRFHLGMKLSLAPGFAVNVSGEAKLLAANNYPDSSDFFEGDAHLTGIGGGLTIGLGRQSRLDIGARAWTGSSDQALGLKNLDFKGLEVFQRLSVTL
ncbi:MAG: hypothetical protein AB1792_02745 [Candidatus Zixiibacteriota bacterium]